MATYESDREKARGQAPLRRIPAHGSNLDLSASTVAGLSTSALDAFAGEYVTLLADGGNIGVTIAASVSGVAYGECLPIEDGKFEEFFLSQEDADTGLVYIAESAGAPTLRIMRPKAHTG